MTLEFRLLGDIALLADGQALHLGGTRQRSVFALLVLQRNRPVATELLADRLWPDEQPLTSIKTIQVYVSRLRHALGSHADRLMSSATGYKLVVADDELDAARFERGLRHSREALASGSFATALATLEEALSWWSGAALGDLAAEQFARREADRLEELRLQAIEELLELRIDAGSGRETIGEVRRLLVDQPGRERLWRLLMLALYADGRQGEALQAFQDARRYLADELGLEPGPDLQDLERAILTQEVQRPKEAPPVPSASAESVVGSRMLAGAATGAAESLGRRTRRVVTVLRADVVRSPDEALDPEVLETLDRLAQERVRRAVERHGGTIDRADQDGVTAVFGLIAAREDDALRAIRAAAEMKDGPEVDDAVALRMGVSTGEVVARPNTANGSMTLTGAPLQAASSLASRAAPRQVLLAKETEQLVRGATSTETMSLDPTSTASGFPAFRLLALTDGDAIARRTTTLYVGRTSELDALRGAFERVVSHGAPGLVTVIGAPGVGKSRLVAEALAQISERARILRSRCLPYGDGITYWPVREFVSAALDTGFGDPRDDAITMLRAVFAGSDGGDLASSRLASIIGLSDDAVPAEEIPWAVRRFVETLAAERPLVVLVDDLQWAEPVLLDLLEHVMDLGRGPIMLITIARPELEEVRADWLARSSLALIRLDSLNDEDAETLLDHLAPDLHPGLLRSRLLSTAEGNPLFTEQFVAYVSDAADAGGAGLTDRTEANLPIPPTIGALLAARLDRLPDVERRTLERAAVVGRTFWAGALGEMLMDGDRAGLPRRLARLARRDLIRPERSDLPDEDAYRFRHLLIRDAAYASLPKRERAELHEQLADWLERRTAPATREPDLIVAYHLEQAYRYRLELGDNRADAQPLADRALSLIGPAGLAAEERGDPHAAVSLLTRAADLARPGRQRIELLIALRAALSLAGEREASDAVDSEAAVLLAEHPDESLQLRRWMTKAPIGGVTIAEARQAYDYYERVGDGMGMIGALEVAVGEHVGEGHYIAAVEVLDQAIALAFEIGRADRAATLAAKTSWIFPSSPVPVPDALARLRRNLEWADTNRFARAVLLMHLGELEAMNGVPDVWRRQFVEAKAIIYDLGLLFPYGFFGYPAFLATTELAAGEPARVVDVLQESCSILHRLDDLGRLASLAPLTAQVLLAVGRLDEVERYATWGKDIATEDDLDAQVRWRMAISGLRSRQARHDEAIVLARESVARIVDSEWVVLAADAHFRLADALRAAGDEIGALTAAHEAHRLAAAKQNQAALRKIEAFLAGNS